jgi:hypothetical protein
MIGEQLAVWIEAIKMEACHPGHEAKMVRLLRLFAELVELELDSLIQPEYHSLLKGHLPTMAATLLRWGEDKSTHGLWSILGFGPSSKFHVKFRFFSKSIAIFITNQLYSDSKLLESLTEYSKSIQVSGLPECGHVLEFHSNNHSLSDLKQLIECHYPSDDGGPCV